MRSKIRNIIIIVLGLFILMGCKPNSDSVPVFSELKIEVQSGDFITLNVEVAENDRDRAYGLMNRKEMPLNEGMLFVYDKDKFRHFWMKNTLIPLDILFIGKDGIIKHIHQNAIPHDLTGIPSQMPVTYGLEINGGQAVALGIQVGNAVFHDKIKRTLDE